LINRGIAKVLLKNLPTNTKFNEVKELVSGLEGVTRIDLPRSTKGVSYIHFTSNQQATQAQKQLHEKSFMESTLEAVVMVEKEPEKGPEKGVVLDSRPAFEPRQPEPNGYRRLDLFKLI